MRFRGQVPVAAPVEAVWAVVVDPTSLATCVPGVHDVRRVDPRTFEASVGASVGPIDGQFVFTAVLTDQRPPDHLVVMVDGSDSVTRSRLEATVDVFLTSTDDDASTLAYEATLQVHGRLAILGEMVLRATAGVMIDQVTRCLRASLERPEGTTGVPR
jgi:2-furoyl-CoA dehydrogenase large subunit